MLNSKPRVLKFQYCTNFRVGAILLCEHLTEEGVVERLSETSFIVDTPSFVFICANKRNDLL